MRKALFPILGVALSGCSLHPLIDPFVRVTVKQPAAASVPGMSFLTGAPNAPAAIGDMTCYAVNVTGPGIDSQSGASDVPWDCLQLGTVSNLLSAADISQGVTLKVPSGPARSFQVFGVVGSGLASCGGSLIDLLGDGTTLPALFEVGRANVVSLYQDGTPVNISDSFNTGTIEQVGSCLQAAYSAPDSIAYSVGVLNGTYTGGGNFGDSMSAWPAVNADPTQTQLVSGQTYPNSFSIFNAVRRPNDPAWPATIASRIDVALDATGYPIHQGASLQVTVTAQGGKGGTSGGSGCQDLTSGVTWSGTGFTASVWLGGAPTPHWSTPASFTASSQSPLTLSVGGNGETPAQAVTQAGGRSLIIVSVRSRDAVNTASAACSALHVTGVDLKVARTL